MSKGCRANDTALAASSHGLDGEHTPAVENPAETCADGEVVWSWRPMLASSPAEAVHANRRERHKHPRGDGGKRVRLTGEITKQPLKPSRREGRAVPAQPVVQPCAFPLRTDRGCQPAPGLPCALFLGEGEVFRKTRAHHVARMPTHIVFAVWSPES